jgi:hypothetical protein
VALEALRRGYPAVGVREVLQRLVLMGFTYLPGRLVFSEIGLLAPRFLGNSEDFKDKRGLAPTLPATTKDSD